MGLLDNIRSYADLQKAAEASLKDRPKLGTYEAQKIQETPMPELSQYKETQDLYEQYLKKPVDPQEEERRRRSAAATSAIGHLGNTLSAFSNLIFTGAGAPSQQLPEAPSADWKAYDDRVRDQRAKYAEAIARAKAQDRSQYGDDWTKWYNVKGFNADQEQKALASQNDAIKFGEQLRQQEIGNQMQHEQMKMTAQNMENNMRMGWANYNMNKDYRDKMASSSYLRSQAAWAKANGYTGKESDIVVDTYGNGYRYNLGASHVSLESLMTAFDEFPVSDNVKQAAERKAKLQNGYDGKKAVYREAIANAMKDPSVSSQVFDILNKHNMTEPLGKKPSSETDIYGDPTSQITSIWD